MHNFSLKTTLLQLNIFYINFKKTSLLTVGGHSKSYHCLTISLELKVSPRTIIMFISKANILTFFLTFFLTSFSFDIFFNLMLLNHFFLIIDARSEGGSEKVAKKSGFFLNI